MNPDCPCSVIQDYDGVNHYRDAGACRRCWAADEHLPDCECAENIRDALTDLGYRVNILEKALQGGNSG